MKNRAEHDGQQVSTNGQGHYNALFSIVVDVLVRHNRLSCGARVINGVNQDTIIFAYPYSTRNHHQGIITESFFVEFNIEKNLLT